MQTPADPSAIPWSAVVAVVGTLAGVFITAVATLLSKSFDFRNQNQIENRKLRIQKLEELLTVVHEFDAHCDTIEAAVTSATGSDQEFHDAAVQFRDTVLEMAGQLGWTLTTAMVYGSPETTSALHSFHDAIKDLGRAGSALVKEQKDPSEDLAEKRNVALEAYVTLSKQIAADIRGLMGLK